jgi:hypothetical protein
MSGTLGVLATVAFIAKDIGAELPRSGVESWWQENWLVVFLILAGTAVLTFLYSGYLAVRSAFTRRQYPQTSYDGEAGSKYLKLGSHAPEADLFGIPRVFRKRLVGANVDEGEPTKVKKGMPVTYVYPDHFGGATIPLVAGRYEARWSVSPFEDLRLRRKPKTVATTKFEITEADCEAAASTPEPPPPSTATSGHGYTKTETLPNWDGTHEWDDLFGMPGVKLRAHSTDGDKRDMRRCVVTGPPSDPREWTATLRSIFEGGDDADDIEPKDSFDVIFPRDFADPPHVVDLQPGRYGVKWFAMGQVAGLKYAAGDCFELLDGELRDC